MTILAPSYGHAGAIELLAPDLPPVVSPHNTYHLWGREHTERFTRGVVISIGNDLEGVFGDVRLAKIYDCEFCMRWRDEQPIFVARQPMLTPEQAVEAWERAGHYE